MALKKDKAKKKKPRAKKRMTGLVVLDGKRQINRRTGLNRDIPMGSGGGSPNLLQALAMRPAITGQGGFSIQTPDQFKQAQDISTIAEEVKKQRISIGEPTQLTGVQDLTNVEAQKNMFVKPEPKGAGAEPPKKQTQAPMKVQKEQQQRPRSAKQQEQKIKSKSEPTTPMQTEMQPARPSPSAINEPSLATPIKSSGGERKYLAGFTPPTTKFAGGYYAPRQWDGGGHVAGLSSASAPSSLVGDADAMGSPQGR
jgi:hypothetical protein